MDYIFKEIKDCYSDHLKF